MGKPNGESLHSPALLLEGDAVAVVAEHDHTAVLPDSAARIDNRRGRILLFYCLCFHEFDPRRERL